MRKVLIASAAATALIAAAPASAQVYYADPEPGTVRIRRGTALRLARMPAGA